MTVCIWTGETDGDWGTATNWVADDMPEAGDTAIVPADASVNIDGSDDTAVALDALIIEKGCTITIGSRANGVVTSLQLAFTGQTNSTVELAGTGLTYIDLTDPHSIHITAAAASPGTGQYGLNILCASDADNLPTMNIACDTGESVGIAANANESSEVESFTITGGDVTVGDGVTDFDSAAVTSLTMSGGNVVCKSAIITTTITGGTLRHEVGAITTANVYGGTLYYNSITTLATVNVKDNGRLDFSEELRARTVTTTNLSRGISTVIFFRLCAFAPTTRMTFLDIYLPQNQQ